MIYILIISLLVIAIGIYLNFQCKLFYLPSKKLRILEYHSVSTNGFEDQITITKEKLIKQFDYLKNNGYQTFWLSEIEQFEKEGKKLPPKSVVLTFDDGFDDNYFEVLPLLKEYNFKAVCFLVLGRIGANIDWPGKYVKPTTMLINKEQISEMSSHFEFGYHTFKHDSYTKLTFDEIEEDLQKCQQVIKNENLNVYPALAYTFGRYYRKKDEKQARFFSILEKYGIKYGLRIGNRINVLPLKSKFEIQRIDIRGYETMKIFKRRILIGRDSYF
jgi:peptidoglycan/xylan/chitin deacetylase (PgdA/CDA1 family)